jgi:hypothetical protein
MVAWGTRDRVLPYSQAKEAFSRLPEGYLELILECGHLYQVEQPKRFISGLRRFLSGQTLGWATKLVKASTTKELQAILLSWRSGAPS